MPAEVRDSEGFLLNATQLANRADLVTKAQAALNANATYLAIPSPTLADVTLQVARLTRECNALVKMAIADLTNTNGT